MHWYKRVKEPQTAGLRAFAGSARTRVTVEDRQPQRVILLPAHSLRASAVGTARDFLRTLETGPAAAAAAAKAVGGTPFEMKLVDSIHEDGAKLVEITAEEAHKLRAAQPGLQLVPVRYYQPAVRFYQIENEVKKAGGARAAPRKVTVRVQSQTDRAPVAGANVVAFTDFASRTGDGGVTSKSGTVTLTLPASVKRLDRLYVYPEHGFWGALTLKTAISPEVSVALAPIDLSYTDSLRYFGVAGGAADGKGVKVAVVDTGIALGHPDLTVVGGECTVPGEPTNAFGPLGGDHGSHCAGIIAAHGTAPKGIRGMAPAAALYSFRVFPKPTPSDPEPGASNYSIAKAIDRAVAAGCDLLNLSLGGPARDPATDAAIVDARRAGAVVIAAAGNDDRGPVSFPAASNLCVAVSALGRIGLFPEGSVDEGDVAEPFGTDPTDFIARFSNVGPEVDCTGPGVGVISTVPAENYAVMSGTSMATPAVTGIAARLLAGNATLLSAARDEARADNIVRLLIQSCKKLGFGPNFEGNGDPH